MPCGHCGFSGSLDEKSIATIKTGGHVSPDGLYESLWHIHARVMQCPRCDGLAFYTYREWHDEDPDDWPRDILYPRPVDVSDFPDNVRESYEKTFPVKRSSPEAFVVGVGNILSAICDEQGTLSKKDLSDRLEGLADRLPGALLGMAHHLRKLRNRGAHGTAVEANEAQVAGRFMEAILNHFYRNPAELQRVIGGPET